MASSRRGGVKPHRTEFYSEKKVGFKYIETHPSTDRPRSKTLITAISFFALMDYMQNFVRLVASCFAQVGLI